MGKIKLDEKQDLGFGSSGFMQQQRLLKKDGSTNITRNGLNVFTRFELYQSLLAMPWLKFHAIVLFAYLLINLFFATAYYLIGVKHLAGVVPGYSFENFLECFFFSTQTFTTVGYGRVSPQGYWANAVATLESMSGLLGFALATGLLYGRFSKPHVRLVYSQNVLVGKVQNKAALMFRVANARSSHVVEVEAQVIFSHLDLSKKNILHNNPTAPKRLFEQLELQISKISILSLGWTIVHFIDEGSPLWGLTQQQLQEQHIEIMVLLKGYDELYSQTLYSRTSYTFDELIFGANFDSIIKVEENGETFLELHKLNSYTYL